SGFSSPLVKQVGLGQPGYHVIGIQAKVSSLNCNEVEVYFDQKIAPGFFAWLAPVSQGQALAGLMTRESPREHLQEWLADLASRQKIKLEEYQIRQCGIPMKPLPVTWKERLIVVGDAAGQVKPTTGGGIYFGLQSAGIAAAVLHEAIAAQDFSSEQLRQYDRQWRTLLLAELKREYFARRAYQLLSNRQIDGLFKTALKQGIVDSLMSEYTSFDNHGSLLLKGLKLTLASQAKRFGRYLSGWK
ncbi:MAG TPA: NAD(P)/FAD-dependent oxidoreductase, partial [Dehalococcoidales bacterium]|nr:NAD(P)/FAD-dependent oxidoreductase [Dehalococcoidales bacterium]